MKFARSMLLYERVLRHDEGADPPEAVPVPPDELALVAEAGFGERDGGSKLRLAQLKMASSGMRLGMTDLAHYYYTVFRKRGASGSKTEVSESLPNPPIRGIAG